MGVRLGMKKKILLIEFSYYWRNYNQCVILAQEIVVKLLALTYDSYTSFERFSSVAPKKILSWFKFGCCRLLFQYFKITTKDTIALDIAQIRLQWKAKYKIPGTLLNTKVQAVYTQKPLSRTTVQVVN
jgi:hypothetical protein